MQNPHVFMDVSIGGQQQPRMTFELYEDTVPMTVKNFKALCTGEFASKETNQRLYYKGSPFHRIIPGFMCQGGDFTNGNGTGGLSIYGSRFPDESFDGKAGRHTGFGCLSMANAGPNTNGSQFFICTADTSWLNGKHVVFGKLISGENTLRNMESVGSHGSGKPTKTVVITNCGEV